MGYWVEVHCDILSDGPKDQTRLTQWCSSNRGSEHLPGAMASSAQKAARAAEAVARQKGWIKRGTEWICPNCRKELNGQSRERSIAGAREHASKRTARLDTDSISQLLPGAEDG